ncbi:hypothetical protein BGZ63DRAFT_458451 [Mariannaea sp. PMI_226]|nr:hypothetical protein BGZ63DRAFT_458451 [Mariannaea sp. PMI_226]
MRSNMSYFIFIWSCLILSTLSRNIVRFPTNIDPDIALSKRVPVKRDAEQDIPFNWSEAHKTIIDINTDPHNLEINCTECLLSGTIHASYDEKAIDIWNSDLTISFMETSAYIDLSILAGSSGEQVIPLWNVRGLNIAGVEANLGLGFYIELVFTLEGQIQASGGFEFTIPDNSWITTSLTGEITGANFNGANSTSLPWDVTGGSATFKVSLRLRTELGATVKGIIFQTGAAVGVYLNLLEFILSLTNNESDQPCVVEATEFWDINAGAYAELDVDVDHVTLSANPAKSTTFYTGPTFTECLETGTLTSTAAATTDIKIPVLRSSVAQQVKPTVVTDVVTVYTTICPVTETQAAS